MTTQSPKVAGKSVSMPLRTAGVPAESGLGLWRIVAVDEGGKAATLLVRGAKVACVVDPTVEVSVLQTAIRRQERVLAQQEDGVWVVFGALRTCGTPGIDEMDDVLIRGSRVRVEGTHQVTLASGEATLVMRAQGLVETVARDITTRARHVHKLVGRLLRLN